jgi:hypothetical protein
LIPVLLGDGDLELGDGLFELRRERSLGMRSVTARGAVNKPRCKKNMAHNLGSTPFAAVRLCRIRLGVRLALQPTLVLAIAQKGDRLVFGALQPRPCTRARLATAVGMRVGMGARRIGGLERRRRDRSRDGCERDAVGDRARFLRRALFGGFAEERDLAGGDVEACQLCLRDVRPLVDSEVLVVNEVVVEIIPIAFSLPCHWITET